MSPSPFQPLRNAPLLWAIVVALHLSPTALADQKILFNRDVRPILSQHCFACHGPDANKREGELRLDLSEGALKGGESGDPAILPSDPDQSPLWQRVNTSDPDEIMPPADFHKELTAAQKETLHQWIDQGAAYQDHWAFIAPAKTAPPEIPGLDHPIDRFIAARLQDADLKFSPPASTPTILRRLSLDLTGLPPSAFEPSAFRTPETAIAHLLASPHFGERMALPWLDAARYADTNGYSIDGGRHAWLWRDWVIHAFNTNKPYNDFLVEQLAGDLLPEATEAQLIATAYNRNNTNTHEGGTIPAENLNNYVADRVKTVGESILGLTTACAQCHDHKYDPFTQQDYYQLYAFFNTVSDKGLDGYSGVNSRPTINAFSPLRSPKESEDLQREIAQAEKELHLPAPEEQQQWEAAIRQDEKIRGQGFQPIPLTPLSATLPNGNPDRLQIDHEHRVITVSRGDYSAYNICCEIPVGTPPVQGLRVHFEPGPKGTVGYGEHGTLVLNTLSPCLSPYPAKNIDHNSIIPAARITASSQRPGFEPDQIRDTRPINGWSPANEVTDSTQHLTYTFPEPLDVTSARFLTTELVFGFGKKASPARFHIELFTGHDPDSPHPAETLDIVALPATQRSPGQADQVRAYFETVAPAKALARHRLANLRHRLVVLSEKHSVMVMDTAAKPRVTHFLERGVYSSPKHVVHPGTPSFLPPVIPGNPEASAELTRLDLAHWLTRPDHPLTARVAVNNIWAIFFGRGLVSTRADFGSQGEWPTHPELLDWLAVDFQESGWDVKELVTLIVTSKTYQQSSTAPPELLERDPSNDLLARGPRFRLPAEHIRDQALAVSGLLVPRLGGPSVKPYQPGDLWRQISHYGSTTATAQTFVQQHGENLYRRSLYTYWKRTLPPPSMAAFDAPNRETCRIGRSATNTPLQAFVLLNDPQFVEAARAFAAQQLLKTYPSDRERLAGAFESMTARPPKPGELDTLEKSLHRELQHYESDPAAAKELLAIGESPSPPLPVARHAAWTNLCQLLINLSETVTRY
jgi:cytochrome c553